MTIKEYIIDLRRKQHKPEYASESEAIRIKLRYAVAYSGGVKALDKYRDKLIASKINAVVDRDAQLAILFNKDKHPDEYEAYQKLRVDKKAEADSDMAAMKAELEIALSQSEEVT